MHPLMRLTSGIHLPAVMALLGCVPLGYTAAVAQTAPRPPGEIPYLANPVPFTPNSPAATAPLAPAAAVPVAPAAPARPLSNVDDLKARDQELAVIRAEQRRALGNEAKLKREIESIGDDRRKLNGEMIEAAGRVRAVEQQIARTEARLAPLDEREEALRKSLDARRGVLAEILAALQRIGRHPPPAIMVRAEDALQSLRSAMLLGALLPEMRQEAEGLMADLGELVRMRSGIAEERAKLATDLAAIADDRARLALLLEQRQKTQAEVDGTLAAERQRAAGLARQAEDLKELMTRLEQNLDRSGRAARASDEKKALDIRPDLAALKDPGRLAPAVAFVAARGLLPLPVNGIKIKEFGGSDGLGGTEKGLSIGARPGAQVTAPCDGWVVYAGPFRNYGQLLILNAGGGYHVLLAGMERISVDLGQFVVTGEPVAIMGGRVQTAAIFAIGSGQPVLYVEFRKDGTPVDPGPWWAASESEKVRG
jgi:septal ring factor EnvC (AmiA/AmiB activator)